MGIRTIEANQWLVVQSDLPAYFLHKLIKGRVGIYEDGEKIDTVEVNEERRSLNCLISFPLWPKTINAE